MEFIKKRHIPRRMYIKRGFGGYCPRVGLSDSQWFREENLSTRAYPYLRPRAPRRQLNWDRILALGHMDGLCLIRENSVTYGNTTHNISLGYDKPGDKEVLSFGSYLIILPDMVWINTARGEEGNCEVMKLLSTRLTLNWCDEEGNLLPEPVVGKTPPENREQFWLDTSGISPVLMEYGEDLGKWRQVVRPTIRLTGEEVGELFPKGTRVLFGQCSLLEPYLGNKLFEVLASGRDYLVVEGSIDRGAIDAGLTQLVIHSPMPLMDHIIVHENRLWGCRYGLDHNGNFVNEIYASALGDFTSWYSFRGIASDSYVLSLGEDGPFTGAAVVGGYPVFFKENSLHKIYGTGPENYRLQSLSCVGMAYGSSKSGAIMDNALVYLGRDGFYRYDGSVPQKISKDLEGQTYSHGVGAVLGSIYYGAVEEKDGTHVILTFDGEKGLWHRESGPRICDFCRVGGVLYYITDTAGLFAMGIEEGTDVDKPLRWEAETGLIRRQEDQKGYFTALRLRVTMEPGSSLSVFADFDSRGVWEPLGQVGGMGTGSREIPLRIRRCDHFRLKLKGMGDMTLYDLRIEMEG